MPDLLTAKTNRQYGLQLFAFREQLPKEVNSIISKIAKAGYKQVEPFGYSKANGNKVPSRMSRSCGIFLLALNGFI